MQRSSPRGRVNRTREHLPSFIHFLWLTEVIESNLETIKIIYDCLFFLFFFFFPRGDMNHDTARHERDFCPTSKGQRCQGVKHILLTQWGGDFESPLLRVKIDTGRRRRMRNGKKKNNDDAFDLLSIRHLTAPSCKSRPNPTWASAS